MFRKNKDPLDQKMKKAQNLLLTDTIVTATGEVYITNLRAVGGLMMESFVEIEGRDKHGNPHDLTFDWNAKVRVK